MREYQKTYLFRISFKKRNNWEKKKSPIYMIAANQMEISERLNRANIFSQGFEVSQISLLGTQYGDEFVKE